MSIALLSKKQNEVLEVLSKNTGKPPVVLAGVCENFYHGLCDDDLEAYPTWEDYFEDNPRILNQCCYSERNIYSEFDKVLETKIKKAEPNISNGQVDDLITYAYGNYFPGSNWLTKAEYEDVSGTLLYLVETASSEEAYKALLNLSTLKEWYFTILSRNRFFRRSIQSTSKLIYIKRKI